MACRSSGLCNRIIGIASPATSTLSNLNKKPATTSRNFTSLTAVHPIVQPTLITANPKFLQFVNNQTIDLQQPNRTVIKFSWKKGKRKSVKCVLRRFKRLHWGGWIRTRCGRQKKMFKKSQEQKRRLRQHVLVNSTQAWLLDSMVGPYWRKPRHYIDDPYEPYHEREFEYARKKPIEYWPTKEEYQKGK